MLSATPTRAFFLTLKTVGTLPLFNYRTIETKKGNAIIKTKCPNPIGYFTVRGDDGRTVKYPAPDNSWTCPVCGPRKLRRFLYQVNEAARTLMRGGYRFRGLTVTLGSYARNKDIGKYWHRFVMSLKKAGYRFDYLWVKEFQKNGKLHLHALVTAFIPWNVIKYYWKLATEGTSHIVWIAKAAVLFTAAYMAKYMTKDMLTAPFRKGERRYSMSKGVRSVWPKLKKTDDDGIQYDFNYQPDDIQLLMNARVELSERLKRRRDWAESGNLKPDKGKKCKRLSVIKRYKPKHNKSNFTIIKNE